MSYAIRMDAWDREPTRGDTQQQAPEVEVTPEMIAAGARFLLEQDLPPSRENLPALIKELFRAMLLAQPSRSGRAFRL